MSLEASEISLQMTEYLETTIHTETCLLGILKAKQVASMTPKAKLLSLRLSHVLAFI